MPFFPSYSLLPELTPLLLILACYLLHPTITRCSLLELPLETQPEYYGTAASTETTSRPPLKPTCKFPAIFNFGDSNSDTGGLSAAFGQVGPPSGETYFHTPMGRYSDGRLKIDFIAQSLGLPYLSAFLDAVGSNFTHGVNFATGGSTIRPPNITLHQSGYSPISLNVQSYEFNDFQRRSQIFRTKGEVFKKLLPNEKYFSDALYTFDIGQNDLTSGYYQNMSTDQVKSYIPDVLGQFSTVIKSIYDKGGRYFWIHNTGPVGCLPYIMENLPVTSQQIDQTGCSIPYNDVAHHFNLQLKHTVIKLRNSLPHSAITYVDVYSVMYDLITHGEKYGFKHPLRACCGRGGKYNYNKDVRCGGKVKIKTKDGKVITETVGSCEDPSVMINWDGVHYTEAGNKWVFDRIVDGVYSDPPNSLNMACHR